MSTSKVVTRFAPSPSGQLHIGSARTALFNWLFARRHGGQFLLRIEDTDKERSTASAAQSIFKGLAWLGLDHDGAPTSQVANVKRHREVALAMLSQGHAYKCFSTQDEISEFRQKAKAEKHSSLFLSPWRDTHSQDHPDAPFVVRLKVPRDGETGIDDKVQGNVVIKNTQIDDMILLRSDGSPVYMLAVVVDDHDMGVTHIIRGDDHLNNAARQIQIYNAMGWNLPVYAHIPLIHGPDGKKMSKRHGATGVDEYQTLGYSAAGMRNYLARLGWSHGDSEFFSDEDAKKWFDLEHIGRSPSRFDFKKLANISGQHIATRLMKIYYGSLKVT
jgi:glutamyl-tRNA synthetase